MAAIMILPPQTYQSDDREETKYPTKAFIFAPTQYKQEPSLGRERNVRVDNHESHPSLPPRLKMGGLGALGGGEWEWGIKEEKIQMGKAWRERVGGRRWRQASRDATWGVAIGCKSWLFPPQQPMYVSVCLCVVTYDPSVESVFVVLQHFPFLSLSKPHFLCLLPISLYLLVLVFVGCLLFLSHILVFFIQHTLRPLLCPFCRLLSIWFCLLALAGLKFLCNSVPLWSIWNIGMS